MYLVQEHFFIMPVLQNIKVSVDAVVFGYTAAEGLLLMLIKRKIAPFKDIWALPGGLVLNAESLENAVYRELKEETGIELNYLEQLYTFGSPKRDPRNRVVSVAYFGLVRPDKFKVAASTDASEARWFTVNEHPQLAFDHEDIVRVAVSRLRNKLVYQPIGFELLNKEFPFSDLERLYVTVLGRPIDRRNFKKKVMRYGILTETGKRQPMTGSGRPGILYKFNERRYFELVKQGIYFEI